MSDEANSVMQDDLEGTPMSEDVTRGLPADLVSVLRAQDVIVSQDAAVFELIAAWGRSPSATATAQIREPGAWPLRTGSGGPLNADTEPSGGEEVGSPVSVYIELWSGLRHGSFQLSISLEDEKGYGHGFRIFGPGFIGKEQRLVRHKLTVTDAQSIRPYLDLLSGDSATGVDLGVET